MKTVSANLKAHLQGEVLTVCTLWKITRADAQVFGFTDHSRDITYLGQVYSASSGYVPSSIKTTATLSVDNLDLKSVLSSASITEVDVRAGLWDFATVEIMVVNYKALADGHMMLRKGWTGNVRTGRSAFVAELRGMMQALQQTAGRIYSAACDVALGSTKCGITLASFTVTGTVTSSGGTTSFTDTSRGEADRYFEGGLVTWTAGDNDGYSMEVKSFASGVFALQQPMPNAIAIGDTYSVSAGCDKSLDTCVDKFSNAVNFRGFPHLPGKDRLVSGT